MTHDDLVILTAWMAENDYSAADVAYAVEKAGTDKFADELEQAKAALKEETEVAEDNGVIWDNPESPEAKRCIEEISELTRSLRADRVAGYPSETGRPILHLVR